jgi:hypothetical protein
MTEQDRKLMIAIGKAVASLMIHERGDSRSLQLWDTLMDEIRDYEDYLDEMG